MQLVDKARRLFHIPPKLPKYAWIDATNVCNQSCKMCLRDWIFANSSLEPKHMSLQEFNQIVKRLPQVKYFHFAGFGETFLNPAIFNIFRSARMHGKIISAVTSANWGHREDEIVNGINTSALDVLYISVDSVCSSGDGHKTNLDSVASIIGRLNCKIIISTVMLKSNLDQLQQIIDWANALNCRVEFGHYGATGNAPKGPSREEEEKAIFKLYGDNFTSHIHKQSGLGAFAFRMWTRCPLTFDMLYVMQNGEIAHCCWQPESFGKVGNILKEDLVDIWKSLISYRTGAICEDCPIMNGQK